MKQHQEAREQKTTLEAMQNIVKNKDKFAGKELSIYGYGGREKIVTKKIGDIILRGEGIQFSIEGEPESLFYVPSMATIIAIETDTAFSIESDPYSFSCSA